MVTVDQIGGSDHEAALSKPPFDTLRYNVTYSKTGHGQATDDEARVVGRLAKTP